MEYPQDLKDDISLPIALEVLKETNNKELSHKVQRVEYGYKYELSCRLIQELLS